MESFNGELLTIEVFRTLLAAKVTGKDYRQHYNTYRPHSFLGYRTSNEITLGWHSNPELAKTTARKTGADHRKGDLAHDSVAQVERFPGVDGNRLSLEAALLQ